MIWTPAGSSKPIELNGARQEFHDFLARIVPPLSCSDRRLVDLYHYIAYAVRLNLVDIPFEPYADPYLTYSKVFFGDDAGLNMWVEKSPAL